MSTSAQIAANQQNAQLSTGPTSETGKAKSSLNAVKTGLTGRTVLLPNEDAVLYEAHLSHFTKSLAPVGDNERNLAQSLADTEWRLLRIPALEMGIYAIGRLEFAELFPNQDESARKHLIEAKVFLAYQRQLNNLSVQEGRLRRQREKDTATLRELQKERQRQSAMLLDKAARKPSTNSGTTNSTPAHLGSNFQLPKSSSAPWISTSICSLTTSGNWTTPPNPIHQTG